MTANVIRNYHGSDALMLQTSKLFRTMFIEDKDQFSGIDAEFADPFADNWQAKIVEAEDIAQDVMLIDEMAAKTEKVQEVLEKCRQHFQNMKYYIDKAFANSKAVRNSFGYNDFKKVRNSEDRMIRFLQVLSTVAGKYTRELTSAGYTVEDIAAIDLLRYELDNANNAQEAFKKERTTITEERVKKLCECWDYSLKVNRASKIIFADQPAKLKAYTITSGTTTPEPETEPVLP